MILIIPTKWNQTATTSQQEGRSLQNQEMKKLHRPIELTILLWVFVLLMGVGWLRFVGTITGSELIRLVSPAGLYWYLLLMGFAWGLAALPIVLGILVSAWWTPKYLWIAAVFYPVSYWFERLILWPDPGSQRNGLFFLLLTGLWIGLVIWTYQTKRFKRYFIHQSEKDELKNEFPGKRN